MRTFTALAKELSTDPGSKDKGGLYENLPTGNSGMVAEFENAAKALGAGQTSGPVKSSFGFHIIRVDSITRREYRPSTRSRKIWKQGLAMENQRTAFEAWFEEIKKQYADKIEYAEEFKTPTTATTATTSDHGDASPADAVAYHYRVITGASKLAPLFVCRSND